MTEHGIFRHSKNDQGLWGLHERVGDAEGEPHTALRAFFETGPEPARYVAVTERGEASRRFMEGDDLDELFPKDYR